MFVMLGSFTLITTGGLLVALHILRYT